MRVWDIPLDKLCIRHRNGMHNEIHAMWNIITQGLRGFSQHPETMRWAGRLRALYILHGEIADTLKHHSSPLDSWWCYGLGTQDELWQSVEVQRELLFNRCVACRDLNRDNKEEDGKHG